VFFRAIFPMPDAISSGISKTFVKGFLLLDIVVNDSFP